MFGGGAVRVLLAQVQRYRVHSINGINVSKIAHRACLIPHEKEEEKGKKIIQSWRY